MRTLTQTRLATATVLVTLVAAEGLIIIFALLADGPTLTALQTTTRFSGRLSLFTFSIIFLLKNSLQEHRLPRQPFLVFAVVHGIHLIELLAYLKLSEPDLIPIRLAGGFVAYLIIFIMPWLHYRFLQGRITQTAMSMFENVMLYYVWFIFLMAYIPRILGKLPGAGGSFIEHVILFAWVIIIFIFRFVHQIRKYTAEKNTPSN